MTDTHLGMILLYTAVNVSLAVWLLKGFIDEIPREYEEAALVDGYTRLQAFVKTVLPQADPHYEPGRERESKDHRAAWPSHRGPEPAPGSAS